MTISHFKVLIFVSIFLYGCGETRSDEDVARIEELETELAEIKNESSTESLTDTWSRPSAPTIDEPNRFEKLQADNDRERLEAERDRLETENFRLESERLNKELQEIIGQ